jgi:pimeloyl-ACP methyl ester carboxylesterase
MDYRGFGLSEGNPTEEGMYEDVRTCLRWLKENGANNNRVFIYGYSLGTAPATEMAAYFDEFKPRKLILEAPFASAENLGQESTLINFDSKYMADLKFNNVDKIKDVSQPFLLFHGEKDDYLKISNGEIIFKNYSGVYGDFVRVPEANHSGEMGIPPAMGLEDYINTIHEFLKR